MSEPSFFDRYKQDNVATIPGPAPEESPPRPDAGGDRDDEQGLYGGYKVRGGVHALRFHWLDGDRRSRDYGCFLGTRLDGGPHAALLEFSGGLIVRIAGRNLEPLLDRIEDKCQIAIRQVRRNNDLDETQSAVYEIEWIEPGNREPGRAP